MEKREIMDVLHNFVQNSVLVGLPRWYKLTTLILLAAVLFLIFLSFYALLTHGLYHPIGFGY